MTARRERLVALALVLGAVLAGLAWLLRRAASDPDVVFFPRDARAEWIVYPSPPDLVARPRVELEASFTRAFELARAPQRAVLSARAFHRGEVLVNGTRVAFDADGETSWKAVRAADVAALLHAGANAIELRARAADGPPAAWLALEGDGLALRSDRSWRASLAGATELAVRPAATPMSDWSSSRLAQRRGPRTLPALARSWPRLALFFAIGAALVLGLRAWTARRAPAGGRGRNALLLALVPVVLGWTLLFWNNRALSPGLGFDCDAHREYVRLVERGTLPLADAGWQTYQPPLYYLTAAGLLKLAGRSAAEPGATPILRSIGWLAGVLQAALVFASLRLVFPGRPARALLGLVLAAALPMQLYLCQYVTNETFAGLLCSAAILLALRILVRGDDSLRAHVVLGSVLGLALLSKVSALLALVLVLAAIGARLAARRVRDPRVWARTLGATVAACALVSGWHYARVAARFGNPFIGVWDPATGFLWWQDPGYRVAGDYLRFGRSLVEPVFSSMHSVPDGIYSTLWGDAMVGGRNVEEAWPPWDYELMACGYLLALLPSIALLVGLGAALASFVRAPSAAWLLLLGFLGATVFALLEFTLAVPMYADVKAFYASSALIPFCALAAWGLDLAATRLRAVRTLVLALFAAWALASFATYWARDGRPSAPRPAPAGEDPRVLVERAFAAVRQGDAAAGLPAARRAAELAPDLLQARVALALLHSARGELAPAIAEAREALRIDPDQGGAHVLLGELYLASGDLDRALLHCATGAAIRPVQEPARLARCLELLARALDDAGRPAQAARARELGRELAQGAAARAAGG